MQTTMTVSKIVARARVKATMGKIPKTAQVKVKVKQNLTKKEKGKTKVTKIHRMGPYVQINMEMKDQEVIILTKFHILHTIQIIQIEAEAINFMVV